MKISVSTCALLTILIASACSAPSSPDFEGLEDVRIKSANFSNVELTANALYNNPNSIGGYVTRTNIKVFVDNKEVTKIKHDKKIKVPANSDFSIPVNISFNPKKLRDENAGILKNALKNLLKNKLDLRYEGALTIELAGVEFNVPVEYEEKISLGLNYE